MLQSPDFDQAAPSGSYDLLLLQITAVVFKAEHPAFFGREQKDSQCLSLIKANIS